MVYRWFWTAWVRPYFSHQSFITMLLLDTYKYLVAPPVLNITAHTCALHRPARMEGLVAGLACQLSCKFAFALQKFPRKA